MTSIENRMTTLEGRFDSMIKWMIWTDTHRLGRRDYRRIIERLNGQSPIVSTF